MVKDMKSYKIQEDILTAIQWVHDELS
jgi:hypothetical protein